MLMTNKTIKGTIPKKYNTYSIVEKLRINFTSRKYPEPKMVVDDVPFVHSKFRWSVVLSIKYMSQYKSGIISV